MVFGANTAAAMHGRVKLGQTSKTIDFFVSFQNKMRGKLKTKANKWMAKCLNIVFDCWTIGLNSMRFCGADGRYYLLDKERMNKYFACTNSLNTIYHVKRVGMYVLASTLQRTTSRKLCQCSVCATVLPQLLSFNKWKRLLFHFRCAFVCSWLALMEFCLRILWISSHFVFRQRVIFHLFTYGKWKSFDHFAIQHLSCAPKRPKLKNFIIWVLSSSFSFDFRSPFPFCVNGLTNTYTSPRFSRAFFNRELSTGAQRYAIVPVWRCCCCCSFFCCCYMFSSNISKQTNNWM